MADVTAEEQAAVKSAYRKAKMKELATYGLMAIGAITLITAIWHFVESGKAKKLVGA